MSVYYEFLPKDGTLLLPVFKEQIDDRLVDRCHFSKFTCVGCGRIDKGTALAKAGLDATYAASTGKRHLCETYDYMLVVNAELRQLLEGLCDDVMYYDIQNSGIAFVIWPKHIVLPDSSESFSRSEQCQQCGVYRSIVFGPAPVANIPDVMIGAVQLEGPQGPMPAWFANDIIVKALKKAKIRGFTTSAW